MPVRPIEIMEKHTYDSNKDGIIDLGAIPNTLTGKDADTVDGKNPASASGLATLDASSLVVQKPADRLGLANLEFTAAKLLRGAGAGASPTEIDVPSFDIFNKFRDFIPWVSLDGFTLGGDAGYTIIPRGALVMLRTAAVIDNDAYIYSQQPWYNLQDTGKVIIIEFPLTYLSYNADQNIWVRLSGAPADPPSETVDHFGWKIIGPFLYASNADGTTQTITYTNLNVAAVSQRTRLKMVFTPGTDLKFYVNDVLTVTHTTNLPDIVSYYFHAHVRTLVAVFREIDFGRVLIEKEHA